MNKVIELARDAGAATNTITSMQFDGAFLEAFYTLARADLEAECERRKEQFASAEFAVNALKAENAKLQADAQDAAAHAKQVERGLDKALAENAKLREDSAAANAYIKQLERAVWGETK